MFIFLSYNKSAAHSCNDDLWEYTLLKYTQKPQATKPTYTFRDEEKEHFFLIGQDFTMSE